MQLVQGFFAQIPYLEQLLVGHFQYFAHLGNVGPFQAVHSSGSQSQPLDGSLINLRRHHQGRAVHADRGSTVEIAEQEEVVNQRLGCPVDGFHRLDGPIGPNFQHQAFVVGYLPHTGTLDVVVNLAHRVEDRVHREHTHWRQAHFFVLVGRLVPHALFNVELYCKAGVVRVQSCQMQFRVHYLKVVGGGDVPSANTAAP